MPSAPSLRSALIRVYSLDMRRHHGNVVVAEVLFRRVTFQAAYMANVDIPGAVLIDDDGALGPISTAVRAGVQVLVAIRQTDELLWVPVKADLNPTGYWAIEMAPLVDYARAALRPDEDIIREAHQRS